MSARWSGKLFNKSMLAEAWYGFSYQQDTQLPVGEWADDQFATINRYEYVPDEFRAVCGAECSGFASNGYFTGPYWFIQDDEATRNSANLKLTNFFQLAGALIDPLELRIDPGREEALRRACTPLGEVVCAPGPLHFFE